MPCILRLVAVLAIDPVSLAGGLAFLADIGQFRDGLLHEKGGFRILYGRNHGILGRRPVCKTPVQGANEIERPALLTLEHGRIDVGHRLLVRDIENRTLRGGGQKGIAEDTHSAMRNGGLVRAKNDIPGQVRILRAASVSHPRPGAGITKEGEAGVHEEIALRVLTEFGCHGAHDGEVVRTLRNRGKHVGHLQARLPPLLRLPRRGHDIAIGIELRPLDRHRQGLAVHFLELRLGIEGIHVGHPPRHVEQDHRLGLLLMMQLRLCRSHLGSRPLVDQAGEREGAHPTGSQLEKFAPICGQNRTDRVKGVEAGISRHKSVPWSLTERGQS